MNTATGDLSLSQAWEGILQIIACWLSLYPWGRPAAQSPIGVSGWGPPGEGLPGDFIVLEDFSTCESNDGETCREMTGTSGLPDLNQNGIYF